MQVNIVNIPYVDGMGWTIHTTKQNLGTNHSGKLQVTRLVCSPQISTIRFWFWGKKCYLPRMFEIKSWVYPQKTSTQITQNGSKWPYLTGDTFVKRYRQWPCLKGVIYTFCKPSLVQYHRLKLLGWNETTCWKLFKTQQGSDCQFL